MEEQAPEKDWHAAVTADQVLVRYHESTRACDASHPDTLQDFDLSNNTSSMIMQNLGIPDEDSCASMTNSTIEW